MLKILAKNKNQNEIKTQNHTIKQRNHYIDALKGIAIIFVVLIHTAFHSGNGYVPAKYANFTLIFEIPMFFFLSGWAFSYSKNNKNYLKSLIMTQIRYMLFMVIIFILINITNYLHYSNNNIGIGTLVNWIFHEYTQTSPFDSVSGSLWFLKVYFVVSVIGAIFLKLLNKKTNVILSIFCVIFVFIITFIYPSFGKINWGVELSFLFFYLFFFILGNVLKDKEIRLFQSLLVITILAVSLFLINIFTDMNVLNINENKFPPNIVFMLWSLFGVVIVTYLKKFFINCKESVLSKIGQNSIYIFFGQGIGASILYFISPYINMDWYFKIIIMFAINLIITGIVSAILKIMIEPITQNCKKFLEKYVYN